MRSRCALVVALILSMALTVLKVGHTHLVVSETHHTIGEGDEVLACHGAPFERVGKGTSCKGAHGWS